MIPQQGGGIDEFHSDDLRLDARNVFAVSKRWVYPVEGWCLTHHGMLFS